MKKLLPIFLLLISCGIEVPQAIPNLFPPNAVKATLTTASPIPEITITWCGLNNEDNFSGYNIYYALTSTDAFGYSGKKIPNKNNSSLSTVPVSRPFIEVTKFSYVLKKSDIAEINSYTGGKIWFYVKAHSLQLNIESGNSLYAEGNFNP